MPVLDDEDELQKQLAPQMMNVPTADTSGVPYMSADQGTDPNEVKRQAAVALEQKHQTGVPGIAGPNMAAMQPPATLPAVQVPEPQPNAQPSPPAIGGPGLASTPVGPPGVSPQMAHDQARQADLNKGSGIDQFSAHHHIAGPILRALDIAGSVFAPNLTRFIPGTTLHHDMLETGNRNALKQDVAQQKEVADTAHTAAETQAIEDKPAPKPPEDKHIGSYVNAEGKNVDKFLRPDNTTYEKASGDVNQKDPAAKTLAAKEGLQQRIMKAYEDGDPATVKKLQGELRAIGDPDAAQKLAISVQGATDRHDASDQKKKDALTKEMKPLQSTLDEAESAHNLQKMAESGNAAADVDLALSFFKTMRGNGGAGIRFTQQEQQLIMGARNSAGDLQAMAQKVIGQGQKFTPQQRQQIVDVIDMHAKAAKSAMERMQGGQSAPEQSQTGGGKDLGAAPAGKAEGSTGTLPDGTKVIVKGGRMISQ